MLISLDNLADLAGFSRCQLAEAWKEAFGTEHRFRPNPELLKAGISWQLQEQYEQRMTPALRRRLDTMARSADSHLKQSIPGKALRSGITIIREWQGQNHVVMVADKEFVYGGKRYRSLSSIAREITGTRWNGPAFFGLRPGAARIAEVAHG